VKRTKAQNAERMRLKRAEQRAEMNRIRDRRQRDEPVRFLTNARKCRK
jgi:hypothetical protein